MTADDLVAAHAQESLRSSIATFQQLISTLQAASQSSPKAAASSGETHDNLLTGAGERFENIVECASTALEQLAALLKVMGLVPKLDKKCDWTPLELLRTEIDRLDDQLEAVKKAANDGFWELHPYLDDTPQSVPPQDLLDQAGFTLSELRETITDVVGGTAQLAAVVPEQAVTSAASMGLPAGVVSGPSRPVAGGVTRAHQPHGQQPHSPGQG